MRKHCRTRVRSRGKIVLNATSRMVAYFAYAQKSEKWMEWTLRTISQRQALILVAAGEAEPVTRLVEGVVRVVGYRALKPTNWERPSPCTLTLATMIAVGREAQGCPLTRRQRDEVVKFRVWPMIGDTKAVAVRPPMTAQERKTAEAMLARGYPRAAPRAASQPTA